jgi:hypothetical protein
MFSIVQNHHLYHLGAWLRILCNGAPFLIFVESTSAKEKIVVPTLLGIIDRSWSLYQFALETKTVLHLIDYLLQQ